MKEVKEMEDIIVERWNSVVKKDDVVYHHGDFAFAGFDETKRLVKRLNGRIFLILGNHDSKKSTQWYLDAGFHKVSYHTIIVDHFFILSHIPIVFLNDSMPYVNIHGHTHDECYKNPQRVNVSWEVLNGYPISFDEIKARFNFEGYDTFNNDERHNSDSPQYQE